MANRVVKLTAMFMLFAVSITTVSAQAPPPPPPAVTKVEIGNFTQGQPDANGNITVTFPVTRELDNTAKAFVSESTECVHVRPLLPNQSLTVNRGPGGTPAPGGGPVTITYTVSAKQGWVIRVTAGMKFTDGNNQLQEMITTKDYTVN